MEINEDRVVVNSMKAIKKKRTALAIEFPRHDNIILAVNHILNTSIVLFAFIYLKYSDTIH